MTKLFNCITSNEIENHIWEEITVRGWLHISRIKGQTLAFLILRDRWGLMQIVIENPEEITKLQNLTIWAIISATWKVVEVPRWKFKAEISNAKIQILTEIKEPSPIDISKPEINADFDTIHENKVVYLRHPRQYKIFKIASEIEKNVRSFFYQNDFTQINTPKIIWFPTEWWAEVFEFDYFGRPAYLAQSPQFYKQIMCGTFERVFEIGRAYRAEKSNTSRHTTEILMLDMEMAFIDSFEDVLKMTENMLKYVVEKLREENTKILDQLQTKKPKLTDSFPRFSLEEVHNLCFEKTWKDYRWEDDLAPEEEVFICDYCAKNNNSEACFVYGFPWSDAKFYHKQSSENPQRADRADLLFRGLELATVTRRETNYEKVISQIKSQWYDPENPWLKHFLDAFKYWMPEQWGFGFGISRFVEKLLWLQNIKEAELFPRDIKRLDP